MVAKSKSNKRARVRRNTTQRTHQALRPQNALQFYKTLNPILKRFLDKHSEFERTLDFYKGTGYRKMNQLLNFNKYEMQTYGTQLFVIKQTITNSPLQELYDAALKGYEANPSDLLSAAKADVIYNVYEITNLRRAFKLFKAPANYVLPTLFRGLNISEPAKQPFYGMTAGQTITMSGFQSCSLSIETAISFQTCSSNGPCCLFVLQVTPGVKFLPLFWSSSESYNSSEHEVLLEPFTEFQLDEKRTEHMPIEVARKCNYTRFNADGSITIDVYYITVKPPKANASTSFDGFVDKIKTNFDESVRSIKLELDFEMESGTNQPIF